MNTYTFQFRRESKSRLNKIEPDVHTMTVEAETPEDAMVKVRERWETYGFVVHIMRVELKEVA